MFKTIETLESNRLSNTRNAIPYNFPYVLAPGIKQSLNGGSDDHDMGDTIATAGGTIASRATLIYFADEDVGYKLSRPSGAQGHKSWKE